MERHVILGIIGFSLLAMVIGLLILPGERPGSPQDLPWRIETTPDGGSAVFGIHLGATTLAEAEAYFGDETKVTLFAEEGKYAVEAYYDSIELAGLRARMVFTIGLRDERLQRMYERGLRISRAESGARKVSLDPEDLDEVRRSPIAVITYLPKADLPPAILERRFGEPAERIADPESGVMHWLYPSRGLDIAVVEDGDEVLQYVRPDRFYETVIRPLEESAP